MTSADGRIVGDKTPPMNDRTNEGATQRLARFLRILWLVGMVLAAVAMWVPSPYLPQEGISDKLMHGVIFTLLAVLPTVSQPTWLLSVGLGLSMIPFSIVLEIGQLWVPGRSFEVLDIEANTLGVLLGVLAGTAVRLIQHWTAGRSS